jgi:hypothetical protein
MMNTTNAYVVRDSNRRTFLNRRVYSGRIQGIWGKINEAAVFNNLEEAQSCASNINSRRPDGYSAYQAQVYPITIRGRQRSRRTDET